VPLTRHRRCPRLRRFLDSLAFVYGFDFANPFALRGELVVDALFCLLWRFLVLLHEGITAAAGIRFSVQPCGS